MTAEELEKNHGFNIEERPVREKDNTIIKVVGVGGGGGNAITYMFKKGIPKISYALCNTDRQAMNASPVNTHVLLGPTVTKGLGAGNNPTVARDAAEESVPELTKLFSDGTQMVFITAGMGGGTGTGAAPVVARVAHEMGLLTIGIVTLPFLMEGEKKILKALEGAKEMSKYVDALMVINNEILVEQYGDLDFVTAFAKADDTLSNAANSIAELIYTEGYMNVDFKDVETTLRDSGVAVIATGYGEGEHRVTAAVKDALNSPLLRKNDIETSKKILFNLYCNSKKPLSMSEINEFKEFTKKISGLDMIYGLAFDDTLEDRVKVSILASGFKSDLLGKDEEGFKNLKDITIGDFNSSDEKHKNSEASSDIEKIYGREKAESFKQHRDSANFIILSDEMMENDRVLELLESTPAYNRETADAEDIRAGRIRDDFKFDAGNTPFHGGGGSRSNDSDSTEFILC